MSSYTLQAHSCTFSHEDKLLYIWTSDFYSSKLCINWIKLNQLNKPIVSLIFRFHFDFAQIPNIITKSHPSRWAAFNHVERVLMMIRFSSTYLNFQISKMLSENIKWCGLIWWKDWVESVSSEQEMDKKNTFTIFDNHLFSSFSTLWFRRRYYVKMKVLTSIEPQCYFQYIFMINI